ncbi:MAG: iron-containing alcohol dehydrogenase family protein [Desulfomonilaceae bacterium]
MHPFDLGMNYRIIYGEQSAVVVSNLAAELVANRVLLVTDPGIQAIGLDRPILESLRKQGASVLLFNGVEPNPTTENVDHGLAQAREFRPSLLVALGGGSAMDCAKAINIRLHREGRLQDYAGSVLGGSPLLPLVALPTTAGTGSEVTPFLLISDSETHAKIVIRDPQAIPKVAVLDPNLTRSLPAEATLYAGLDALVHCFESYVAVGSQPYTEALAVRAINLILHNLPRVMAEPTDLHARGRMLVAANLAGMAFSLSYLGLAHSFANALTKIGAVPHGKAVGMMIPWVIRFNHSVAPDKYHELATYALGDKCPQKPDESGEALADFVQSFEVSLGMPAKLNEVGIKAEQIPNLVEETLRQATIRTNPRNPSSEELKALLQSAL